MGPRTRRASALLLVVGVLLIAGCGSSGDNTADTAGSTTTTKAMATTAGTSITDTADTAATTATTDTTTGEQPDAAVWPSASSSTRYTDPVDAAKGFATSFLGFVNPILGNFQQGDTRSGEVAVRATDSGPTTTVMVRQLGADDSWWVLGAATPNLQIAVPEVLAAITSPLRVSGTSTAFEGTINVEVRADDESKPLVAGATMGGSMGEMQPFSIGMTFPAPTVSGGAIVVKTMSARDGNIAEATVIRVHF